MVVIDGQLGEVSRMQMHFLLHPEHAREEIKFIWMPRVFTGKPDMQTRTPIEHFITSWPIVTFNTSKKYICRSEKILSG
jgi:hypothetical protein